MGSNSLGSPHLLPSPAPRPRSERRSTDRFRARHRDRRDGVEIPVRTCQRATHDAAFAAAAGDSRCSSRSVVGYCGHCASGSPPRNRRSRSTLPRSTRRRARWSSGPRRRERAGASRRRHGGIARAVTDRDGGLARFAIADAAAGARRLRRRTLSLAGARRPRRRTLSLERVGTRGAPPRRDPDRDDNQVTPGVPDRGARMCFADQRLGEGAMQQAEGGSEKTALAVLALV